ncbi:MAG TPA: FtsX-like permease family protein, partial [Opitutus sp.]|nr:FtsX-like permease family protein [Opitutus sp.]
SSGLVIGQVAVALMLLTGAGLLIHGFVKALNVDPGFDPRGVIGTGITLAAAHRTSDEAARAVQDRLLQAMEEIPGVSASMLTYSIPFRGGVGINALTLAEDPLPPGSPQPGAYRVTVTPGYLDTLKLRLVEGRFFERADLGPGFDRKFVVDETFAKKFFPNRSAIGGKFTFGGRPEKDADWPTIIGVVRDIPHNGVEDKTGNPFIYQLIQGRPGGFGLYVRSERSAGDTIVAMREKIRQIDPTITMLEARTLESAMDESFDTRRAVMLLMVAFAALALFLSALGIYGVLAYDVSQRTREIGVRGAIGATRGQIVQMVLKQGLWKSVIGLGVGLVAAWLLSRTMTSLLFEVTPSDPIVYVGVSVLLLLVAAIASYLPARRAARIDPMEALRAE